MEDATKVAAKLAELEAETGRDWLAGENTSHIVDKDDNTVSDWKSFICRENGEVRAYPYADFQ